MRGLKPVSAVIIILFVASFAAAADRGRAVRPVHSGILVGPESRITASPDSPWLESVAVAVGPSSGIVLWTQQSSILFARIAADGHPLDNGGRQLVKTANSQQHVAIDAFRNYFVAAWCEAVGSKLQIVAILLDGDGRTLSAQPFVVADSVTTPQPVVDVTCMDAGCLIAWGGNSSNDGVYIASVNAQFVSATTAPRTSAVLLAPKGIGIGVGTDNVSFATAYAEQATYGQSGAFVAKSISPAGASSEVDLMSSSEQQIGSTWMAWDGSQWFILMLDLGTTGGLVQEFRFMRVDAVGRPIGNAVPALLDSVGVPPLCPWSPDVFLYDPQNRRAVWDGRNFLALTQHAIVRVSPDGAIGDRVANDEYFPRGYALSVSTARNGRTIVAYSRDSAVAIRAIDDIP